AGPGGGTLDGNGSGSNKLYGSDGVDVFRITPGKSDDTIYNFDASDLDNPDVIIVDGVDSLNRDAIQLLDNGYVQVSIGGGMLTLINSKGPVSVLNEEGAELTSFDTTGITLSSDNRTLNVSDAYPNSVLTADNFSSLVATIEAANRTEPISIVGNSNSNVIKAGSGGSTLNGGGYIDHLYGGNGADLFQYQFGDSNDVIYNFNSTSEGAIDAIQILGYSGTITRNNFRDSANGNTIIQIGTNTLTLVDPVGAITVFGEDIDEENPFVYSSSLPSGVTYNFNKTKLNVSQNADLDDEQRTFYVENFSNNLKTIDASKYPDAVTLIGDSKANELYAGSGGSSMDGGAAVDKLYGGEGADTFVWQIGEGNDYIFYYSAVNDDAMDVVQILGDTSAITKSSFRDSGKNVVLSMGNSQLTLVEPEGSIKLIDEDGEEIISYDQTLPSGVSYSDNKQNLTIARGTTLENPEFDMDSLANNLRNIDGSAYEGELYLRGNRYANVLRAGSGGSTLEGKAGTDRLYGGNGRDVFVLTVGGGNDVIYNYNGDQEDVIQVLGSAALTNNSFIESNGNVYMQLGNEKVMLASPTGGIEILDENGDELFTYGSSLPSGVHYTDNRTTLVIGENADLSDDELEFSVASYGNNLRNIDASAYDANALVLAGDSYVNSLRAGGAGSSINGGTGADYLYGGAGADTFAYMTGDGNDYIFNYNGSAGDVLQYLGSTTIYRSNFQDQGGNVVLTIGTQRLTFVDAWGPIVLVDSDGDTLEATYDEVLPSGITYNSSHTKLTVGNIDQMENPLLDMATLSNNIRDIDATGYGYEITLKGNDRSNELRAGSGGSSLDGGDDADKLYGGAGADTYVVSVGAGSDQIFNYNGNDGDIIQVYGVRTLTRDAFTDSGSNVRLNLGSERIVLRNPSGTITVMLGDNADETITYGADLPSGVSYSTDKTTLTISRGASLESELFDMATLSNSLRNINGENYEGELNLVGNDKANELHGGSGGSTLDGGAGNDKLYGGTGSDTFIYESGGGNDYIYNYSNADGDVIKLVGVSALDSSAIRESGRNTIVTIGTERLTLVNVSGQIAFVDENDNELLTYGMDLPTGISYNASKTKLTIARGADLTDGNEFDMSTLASNIRDIDASAYDGEIALTGNDRANDLKAGSGGSTLNGGEGNDKLYGGEGADVFVYEYGTGNDHIYNYSDGDTIQLIGVNSIEKSDFRESGRNAILTIGDNRLTIHNSPAQLIVVDESGAELITYAETLPSGVSYNSSKSALAVSATADLDDDNELRVADYVNKLKDINASSYTGAIVLTGDDKANELRAGSGGSTLSGGTGNDKLYAGTGADEIIYSGGNDVVYHFNVDNDSVTFEADLTGSRISGSDIVYQTDEGTLTIKNVASYGLTAITINGTVTADGSGQLPSDYWFEPSTTDDDPLNGLMAINEGVELPTDDPIDQLKASTTALALNTRHKARFNR
ncbi:MAG: hypothetical protein IJU71_08885, partial [Selenomonadaceae bacterium]|nr:hypothetical protein [Selenomonadaceae bacterium]